MGSRTQEVIFLGSGRCYHTMDWFRSAQALRPQAAPTLVTDLIEGESFERLVAPSDRVERLMVIDAVLLKKQSRAGDIWRNLVKLLLLPIQAVKLRGILRRYEAPVVHAHSMYYVAMARLASCSYVATPQGSEVLVRPFRSRAYRAFSRFALAGASRISVDSDAMQRVIRELFGLDSTLVQNGIDIGAIRRLGAQTGDRDKLVSIRGLTENYRIREILDARNVQAPAVPLHFCYPFSDAEYVLDLEPKFVAADRNQLAALGLFLGEDAVPHRRCGAGRGCRLLGAHRRQREGHRPEDGQCQECDTNLHDGDCTKKPPLTVPITTPRRARRSHRRAPP